MAGSTPQPGSQRYDAIILGAGIVGCACARECALAGMRVAIVERHLPGGGSTAAAMGHLVAMDDSPAQLALSHYGRSLWRDLAPQLPPGAEYETPGTLWVAADEEELLEVRAKQATYAAVGVETFVLSSTELAAREPHLRPGLHGALLVPGDAVLYPPVASQALLQQAEQLGAVLYRGALVIQAGYGQVLLADGPLLQSDTIVVATGADTSLLPWLPIQKRKGHLLITDRYPGLVRHQLVELGYLKSAHKTTADSVAFNLQPRRTGQLLIGSSRQYGNSDPATEPAVVQAMLERAMLYMPALANVSALRLWTGFRAATPDKLPLIGSAVGADARDFGENQAGMAPASFGSEHDEASALVDDATLFLAAGFEGLGITNALAAARLLVDLLLQRPSAIPREPYAPSRPIARPGQALEASHA